ncbi:hypothetical protein BTO06_01655 [Tenacibaculum sp. SZ-18]|uniref:SPOR domain-containing protein n=1 Tax=Tenacibaculum sp. SZ-18 TaxID=754423 RepID=UPI000C2D479D|nr:SPOR domain-containing protein [Tenacibaculum sp. SZ-18]AUC13935.1 hypothetical protein BTO06_01655 [Tenacibaculum sp. SZ-18]
MHLYCKNLFCLALLLTGFLYSFSQSNYTDNEKINSLLEKKREYNKNNETIYKIQLYNGNEKIARTIKQNYMMKFQGIPKLKYEAPEWKVHVGEYYSKIEADRSLNKIKEKFTGAIVIRFRK